MVNQDNYKRKIQHLLALAKSPEMKEAKEALLKARELMAKHKLSEEEVRAAEKQSVKKAITDITCSKRRNPWMISLSCIIAENYCCQQFTHRTHNKQTRTIGFIGLEDDAEICVSIFKYAVDCVLSKINSIKDANKSYPRNYVTQFCDSYGFGFAAGVEKAFTKQQQANQEWGLVLVIPQEVLTATQSLKTESFQSKSEQKLFRSDYEQGYLDGTEFDPTHRLSEESITTTTK